AVVNAETGEYGFEDVINPASATGTPNGALDGVWPNGEDLNTPANGLDVYGQIPSTCCGAGLEVVPPLTTSPSPFDANTRPWTQITCTGNPCTGGNGGHP